MASVAARLGFVLQPDETELDKFEVEIKERPGVLHLTTKRFAWYERKAALPQQAAGQTGGLPGAGGGQIGQPGQPSQLGAALVAASKAMTLVLPWSRIKEQAIATGKPKLMIKYNEQAPTPKVAKASAVAPTPVIPVGGKVYSWQAAAAANAAAAAAAAAASGATTSSTTPAAGAGPAAPKMIEQSVILLFTAFKGLEERDLAKEVIAKMLQRAKTSSTTGSPSTSAAAAPSVANGSPLSAASTAVSSPAAVVKSERSSSSSPVPTTASTTSSSSVIGMSGNLAMPNAEMRAKLLASDRKLEQLYDDLVRTSHALTDEEFWQERQRELIRKAQKGEQSRSTPAQKVGVPSAFLLQMKQDVEVGADGIKRFTLTPVDIANIFRTYPKVREAYDTNVPVKLSEQDFWLRFLRSHYFHRDRQNERTVKDPNVVQAEELFGKDPLAANKGSVVAQLNRHSTMVLQTNQNLMDSAGPKPAAIDDGEVLDLRPEPAADTIPLALSEKARFAMFAGRPVDSLEENDVSSTLIAMQSAVSQFEPQLTMFVPSTGAEKTMKEHSLKLRQSSQQAAATVADVHTTTKEVIRRQYNAVQELVRHMWALFPITTQQQEEKGARIATSLSQWNTKVIQLKQGLSANDAELVAPLSDMISAALEKFQQRKVFTSSQSNPPSGRSTPALTRPSSITSSSVASPSAMMQV
ncbi:hypothetical protein CAOG_02212 [Capsaspora owczarzaki ATCC 30864]|uniref:BSD domain-containing protein n=1 Tax=Capsaspora owczarzaki (strain ATCC 30864) TaxID=595528 RepID=A0A0D2WLW2_CAPO3|nr:hypothetical protein CAOG_02212 [Capsaspora owczarzaki ATCC 30864]KJE91003.1 hypothetical protein CAOG_002212 [Capsaspora owczarzaki ATCC 30864]|eukprot:XP_004348962.1 hypothetical protein CAOG_02212 [Capsaspora owczarzaki ATCC 30864]